MSFTYPIVLQTPDTRVPMLTGQRASSTRERGQAIIISQENPPPTHHTHGGTNVCTLTHTPDKPMAKPMTIPSHP